MLIQMMNKFFRRTNGQTRIDSAAAFIAADMKHHPILFANLNETLTLSRMIDWKSSHYL